MATSAATQDDKGMTFRTRPLTAKDLAAVVAIDALLEGQARRHYFERRLAAAKRESTLHAQLAIDQNGTLAGYVLGRVLEGEFGRVEPAMRLEVIGVKRPAQAHGMGAALGAALEGEARRRGIRELRTAATWREHRMLRFLDHGGWSLGRNQVLDCAIDAMVPREARLQMPDEERHRDPNDYSAAQPCDFEPLARDLVDLRVLRPQDLEAVARLDQRITGRDRSAYLRHALAEAAEGFAVRASFAAWVDGSIAGYMMARLDMGDFGRTSPVAILDTIGVDPRHGRKGIGHALLSQLFVNLAALRAERVETVVSHANLDLLAFLSRAGFGPSERLAFVKRLD